MGFHNVIGEIRYTSRQQLAGPSPAGRWAAETAAVHMRTVGRRDDQSLADAAVHHRGYAAVAAAL